MIVSDGEVVGAGWHGRAGGPHAEVIALEQAGARAAGATLYVTLEPCSRHGRTPPCTDAVIAAGLKRVVAGSDDPSAAGGGLETLRAAGLDAELSQGEIAFRCRAQNEAWRTWVGRGRPFVTYKAAVTLDGRMTLPGSRWISGPESRRLVHELRAASDAVAVGLGTVRADRPLLTARDVGAARQPRRIAFGRGPLPAGSELELASGELAEELTRLAAEGIQSLLLEGGATIAGAFLSRGLIDKVLVFVAPMLGGIGPALVKALPQPCTLRRLTARSIGDDVLLIAYVNEP